MIYPDLCRIANLYYSPTTQPYISMEIILTYCMNEVNSDLKSLTDWFRANQLSVNPTKTKYILFSKKVTPMTDVVVS